MSARTVRAIQHEDGHLELLERVDLPKGTVIELTMHLPDKPKPARVRPVLPVRHLGPMQRLPTRGELYDELI